MKNIFTQKLIKILLLMLFCCPIAFTQYPMSYMKYKGKLTEIIDSNVGLIAKEGYYDELLIRLTTPPYSLKYSIKFTSEKYNSIILRINGSPEDINVLDYYLKFEKEEFVETVIPVLPIIFDLPRWKEFDIKGQVFYNDKPLTNHIVNLFYGTTTCYNSITDENGNYIFPKMIESAFRNNLYTLSFKIGNTKYGVNTFTLDEDKIIDFNVTPTWKEFEIKGQILQNGEPLIYRTITLTDQFDFVFSSFTDEDGNYTFPYMREDYNYTLSFEIGDTKYDTTFVLDENKSIDFNLYAPTADIKGQIFKDGKPLSNYTIYTYNEFNLYNSTTDENGNYIFPNMVEKYDYTLFCRVGDIKYDTTFMLDGNKTLDFTIGSVDVIGVNEPEEIPTTYSLSQNYPNPFNPSTIIKYQLADASQVSLKVYDVMGREVATLVNSYQNKGSYDVTFNATGLSSGIYFYRLNAGGQQFINKMLLMK